MQHVLNDEAVLKKLVVALGGNWDDISKEVCHERIQHDNPHGRLEDMTLEGVPLRLMPLARRVLIPLLMAPSLSSCPSAGRVASFTNPDSVCEPVFGTTWPFPST